MSRKFPRLERKKGLYLKDTGTKKGRGVYCDRDIKAGEVIEVTPALLLNESWTRQVDRTLLMDYTFTVGRVSKKLREKKKMKNPKDASCVIMGLMTFCNHDEEPNAEVQWEEKRGTLYHSLVATKRIPKNTEICTSYGEGWFDTRK